jgi:hypothetical protein
VKITIDVLPGVVIHSAPPSNSLVVNLHEPAKARPVLNSVGLDIVEIEGRMWVDISGFTGTISVSDGNKH